MVRKERHHFLFALEILLLGVAHPVRIVYVAVRGKADEPVVRRTVLLAQKMHVVGSNHLHSLLLCELEDSFIDYLLFVVNLKAESGNLSLMEHYLKVIVFSEDILEPVDCFTGLVHFSIHNRLRDLSRKAGGAADKVLVVLLYHLVAHPRTVVHTLDMCGRYYLHQVLVAFIVLGKQDEVIIALFLDFVVKMTCHIDLATYNGLDNEIAVRVLVGLVVRHLEEFPHCIQVAVVGNCYRRHTEFPRPCKQLFDVCEAVENRILGMEVKVYETHLRIICFAYQP